MATETEMRAALEWYAEQVAGCRKLGSIGDPYRHALDADGGKKARAALATPAPASEAEMAAFGASDAACYLYPGKNQQSERAAFCAGAAHAVSTPAPDQDAAFELWQDDTIVASSSGPREQAERDIGHYALVHGQDGPVQIFEVRRVPVATAIRAGISGEGERP